MRIGQQIKLIVINKQANSLYSLIADGQYRATSLGRETCHVIYLYVSVTNTKAYATLVTEHILFW